ncbi:manganese efflux pump [Intestinibacillus sp. Marseille-P6563]|uniref:manganese efflux pump n=1 Tax=Intestinibacillus sp. Marseille-P6563 TaxID=2364792 RepID=UPI000F0693DF|nr:manganese efflux pump [Intestinibacillus sp. Marseille-P6563]
MDCLLVFLMSCDALFACLALGAQRITVEPRARLVLAGVGTGCLAFSFLASQALLLLLPDPLFHYISCGALLAIALCCLFEAGCKRLSDRLAAAATPLTFHLHGLRVVLQIYAETARADADRSGSLSPTEAFWLAVPLSLDSLLTGLSISVTPQTAAGLLLFSLLCGLLATWAGEKIGKRLGHAAGQSASLVSGVLLLIIALCKLKL